MTRETFREWLVRQASSDLECRMPYAVLYDLLDTVPDGDIDLEMWSERFRQQNDAEVTEAVTAAMIRAQKVYVIDQLVYEQNPDLAPEARSNGVKATPDSLSMTPPTSEMELIATATILPCGFRGRDGRLCGVPSVPGTSRCVSHGGAIGDADVRRSLIIQAYGRMIEGADVAVRALLEVAIDGRSEMARVQAAKELLDRVGMTVDAHPTLTDPPETDEDRRDQAIAALRDALEDTRRRLKLVSIPVHSSEIVIDAEAS
jgi:hypothetical protein